MRRLFLPTGPTRDAPLALADPSVAMLAVVVPLDAARGYLDYFHHRWAYRETFANVEHDVAPTAQQVLDLLACPAGWCAYLYAEGGSPSFGCVKFSAHYIASTRLVWAELEEVIAGRLVFPGFSYDGHQPAWQLLDAWHNVWAAHHGLVAHVHDGTVAHHRAAA